LSGEIYLSRYFAVMMEDTLLMSGNWCIVCLFWVDAFLEIMTISLLILGRHIETTEFVIYNEAPVISLNVMAGIIEFYWTPRLSKAYPRKYNYNLWYLKINDRIKIGLFVTPRLHSMKYTLLSIHISSGYRVDTL